MPKSKNRRRRGATAEPSNNTSNLESDLSVIVEGDKVLPTAPEQNAPKLGVTYSRKSGKPIIAVMEPVESARANAVDQPSASPVSTDKSSGAMARSNVDSPADGQNESHEDGAQHSDHAKGDLREIAKHVALSPGPDESTTQKIMTRLRAFYSRASEVCQRAWATAKSFLASKDIHRPGDIGRHLADGQSRLEQVAFTLRIGLGILFVTGGISKLSKLLSPAASDAMVANYTSTTGYINEFFMAFLFVPGNGLTPWSFLTTLSAFELVTGIMLLAGLLVRPIALIYAFLLWSFVIALPVVTTNGVDPGVKTYMAPAIFVQIRDIALSCMMFVLYGLGSGIRSVDARVFGADAIKPIITWEVASLLLRLSMAVVLVVGGLFAGMPSIKTYIEPGMLLVITALAILWGGRVTRYAAGVACAVIVVYMLGKLGLDKGVIGNLNAIKREIALFAGCFVLAARECGQLWTASDVARRLREGTNAAMENISGPRSSMKPAEYMEPAE